jgi:F0F1-type ATP synthase membrane subunit b/b'
MFVGFFLVYGFVSRVLVPKMEQIFSDRNFYTDGVQKMASQLKDEADKIERESAATLENAQIEIAGVESGIISDLRERSQKEKEKLHKLFSEKSKKESDLLAQASEKIFSDVSDNLDETVDAAMRSISCSVRRKLS